MEKIIPAVITKKVIPAVIMVDVMEAVERIAHWKDVMWGRP